MQVEAAVWNLRGARIAVLPARTLAAGFTTLEWDAAAPAGVYLLRVTSGGTSVTRRVVKLE